MTTTPTSGAAIKRYKIGYHSDEWGVRSLSPTGIYDDAGPWVRYEDHISVLAAGQATAAQAVAEPADTVVLNAAMRAIQQAIELIGAPTGVRMRAVRRVLRGAVIVAEDDGKVAPLPGTAYAALPTSSYAGRVYEEGFLIGTCPLYTADQLHAFADATHTLRASHGQAPAPEDSVQEDALSDSVRTPLDSLHADAAYLIGRLREGSMPYARVIEIIRERIDAAKAAIRASAAHGQAPAGATLRSMIEGMSVSVDVSTGDHDAGHRYFGTVTEVMECQGEKHGVTLLVQDAEPNFAAPAAPAAPARPAAEQGAAYAALSEPADIIAGALQISRGHAYELMREAVATTAQEDSAPSRFGSPELQAMIIARCVEKDQADSVQEDAARLLALEAAANQIFNNPPSETSQDVRDVIEWFSGSIRVVLDAAIKQGEKQ